MEFKKDTESMTYIESQLADEPHINVIDKDTFNNRIQKVFNILYDTLKKSFGPGGAGTFVSVYPAYYNTKDGFNIMKNIGWDTKLDQIISDMVMNICSKLNFSVGDGTTTAVIATKSIYEEYIKNSDTFKNDHILPRDIMKRLEYWQEVILKSLAEKATPIRSNDPKELKENIRKVVSISSNNNEEITNMIADLYEELMYPAISCGISKDGTTKTSIVKGYKIDISLTDKIYINNDNKTAFINSADVIMFDHKITKDTYQKILAPLSESCKIRGRKLICIAPYYDETALTGVIRTELMREYKKENDVNLVLTVCKKATGESKILLDDLAMLLNTTMITTTTENDILEKITQSGSLNHIYDYFDLDNRGIPDISVAVIAGEGKLSLTNYNENTTGLFGEEWKHKAIRVGYCDEMNIGLNESVFSGFYYDESIYNKYLAVAKEEYEESRVKSEKIGTFSFELANRQKRLFALGLKTGLIEVGATSELSQGYLKDTVDDAVKAAASAFNNGVVLGCNVTLMKIISDLLETDLDKIDRILLLIIFKGFVNVYTSVLSNAFENRQRHAPFPNMYIAENEFASFTKALKHVSGYENIITCEEYENLVDYTWDNVYSTLVSISIRSNKVFDLTTGKFSDSVINSAETDRKILEATMDLLKLLITGNQLVIQ